jgi:hypothetical protein
MIMMYSPLYVAASRWLSVLHLSLLLLVSLYRGETMAWYAKPAQGYNRSSTEAAANMNEIYANLSNRGYTVQAVSGILGNVQAESGFNPWRWQGDHVNTSNGYGLFQFTPASGYLALSGVTPNMSTTTTTTGATPQDGARQVDCFADDELSKWVSTAWRSYWDQTTYASLYAKRNTWLSQYGSGNSISMAQFAAVTDIEAATFFFLACFEGPRTPNLSTRYSNAYACYEIITGTPPPIPPDPPPPSPGGGGNCELLWLLFGVKNNTRRILLT